jgi:hypothetical protein
VALRRKVAVLIACADLFNVVIHFLLPPIEIVVRTHKNNLLLLFLRRVGMVGDQVEFLI